MIPERIINLALEGDWRMGHTVTLYTPKWVEFCADGTECFMLHQEQIALEPAFWQALGRKKDWNERRLKRESATFLSLVLNEGSTEKYWEKIK